MVSRKDFPTKWYVTRMPGIEGANFYDDIGHIKEGSIIGVYALERVVRLRFKRVLEPVDISEVEAEVAGDGED